MQLSIKKCTRFSQLLFITSCLVGLSITLSSYAEHISKEYFIRTQLTKNYGPVPADKLRTTSVDGLVDSRAYA